MKLNIGDIFKFAIDEKTIGYGQIVSLPKKNIITIIIFKGLYDNFSNINDVLNDDILLFGNTFDAKFYNKDWEIIENDISNIKQINFPFYKIGTDPIYIEDFFENKIKLADENEKSTLNYRSYISPIRFENTLKAYHKLLEWNEEYDELLYSNS